MASLQGIIDQVFTEYTKQLVESAFGSRWGYGDGKPIQEALIAEATRMMAEDAEIRAKIKKRLIGLIEQDLGEG